MDSDIIQYQKQNCIFCKIINHELQAHEIYSDDKIFIVLDINPVGDGHCLILPKEHYQILPQMTPELIGHIFVAAKKMSRILLKSLGIKGTTIFVANGAMAGQKSPHFMIHVIPRHSGDGVFNIPKNKIEQTELVAIQQKIMAKMGTGVKPETKVDLDKISEMFKDG